MCICLFGPVQVFSVLFLSVCLESNACLKFDEVGYVAWNIVGGDWY